MTLKPLNGGALLSVVSKFSISAVQSPHPEETEESSRKPVVLLRFLFPPSANQKYRSSYCFGTDSATLLRRWPGDRESVALRGRTAIMKKPLTEFPLRPYYYCYSCHD